MNHQLIQSFINKLKQLSTDLEREVTSSTVNTKEAFGKIKEMKNNLSHLFNLLKIEESLEQS